METVYENPAEARQRHTGREVEDDRVMILILRPAGKISSDVGVLWIHGGGSQPVTLYQKYNDKTILKCYSPRCNKKGRWSGKVRQCCRYIQTASELHTACLIFRERLCPQPIMLNGLILIAL